VRRKKQEPVASVTAWKSRSPAVQLLNDDTNILVTEMALLLDEVPTGSSRGLPPDDPVEAGQSLPGQLNLGLRYPFPENGPVQVHVGHDRGPSHVLNITVFINNEQV
jgi:hypothetical protein